MLYWFDEAILGEQVLQAGVGGGGGVGRDLSAGIPGIPGFSSTEFIHGIFPLTWGIILSLLGCKAKCIDLTTKHLMAKPHPQRWIPGAPGPHWGLV